MGATLMLATVNVNRLATYMPYLKAGNQNFRISYSSLLIRFSDANSLDEITEPASPTPEECFRLFYSDTGHASAAPLLRGYAKVEPLTIAELNEFGDKNEEELSLFVCFDGVMMTKLHNMRVYEDDMSGANSVPAKAAPNTGAGPSGVNTTKSPARMF
ncbi:hypothetical protein Bca52824_055171 [Brassica carinata]|uniref:Uncharacterized protein n=1 Tax=Brassica carinata TaxID=52824 RepID=A0A8X7UNE3_BRACI|nr:hypothetical protein Bca52824_055171 [Brassica carinata]